MSFFGFSDHDDKGFRDDTQLATRINYLIVGFASVLFFMSGIFNTERDLFSTAFWFDHINVQQAGISANYLFQIKMASQTLGVTTIAIVESLAIWSSQVVFGFLLAKRGKWSDKSEGLFDFAGNCISGAEKFGDVSREKVFWFLALVLAATLDTATDIGWLAGGGGDLGQAILISLVFHNIFSELALFWGGKLALESVFRLLGSFIPKGRGRQPNHQQQKRKGGNQPHNQNQQRPQQQRPSGHRPTNLPPINRGGRPAQTQQRPPIDFMSDDYQE